MDSLKSLSNDDLLSRTRAIVSEERKITVHLLRHLRELEARQLYADRGYPSLFEFLVRELRFSESAAYRRIQAMRLVKDLPEAEAKLAQGELTLSTAAKVQSTMRKASVEEKRRITTLVEGKSAREAERELARLAPQATREYTRWLSAQEVQISFSLERPTFLQLHQLQALRSHKNATGSYRIIVSELVELGQKEWNPCRPTASTTSKKPCVAASGSSRHIPAHLKREVWARDQGACCYKDPVSGTLCGSRTFLQIDHIQPLALGGKTELANLRLLCGAHNRARARKTFGDPNP